MYVRTNYKLWSHIENFDDAHHSCLPDVSTPISKSSLQRLPQILQYVRKPELQRYTLYWTHKTLQKLSTKVSSNIIYIPPKNSIPERAHAPEGQPADHGVAVLAVLLNGVDCQ